MVDKANTAIDLMGQAAADRPTTDKIFVGAQKLQQGNIRYLLTSEATTDWIKQPSVKEN